jgi:nicotinate-nucleotide adenylyltransferase
VSARPRIGVLGGTFDPIHIGHLVLAGEARWQLNLERVVFVPAGVPWRKAGRKVSSFEHRSAMTQLAISDFTGAELSLLEGERPGPSYMAETLAQLASLNPDADLFLVLGADALADLPNWKAPGRIRELARLAVACRSGEELELADGDLPVAMPLLEISSTVLRERIAAGKPIDYLAPRAVVRYIAEHGLYRPGRLD